MIMFARDDDTSPPPLTDEQRELFDDCVPNVEWLAWKRATRWISYEDQLQNGLVGLIDATRRFEPERGLKFWTFALPRVLGAMIDAEREGFGEMIRIPRLARKERTPEEWSRFQGTRFEAIEQWQLNAEAYRSTEADALGVEPDEPPVDAAALWKSVAGLGKRAALVVIMYYRLHMTMREIGENLGLSESRVSQMRMEALEQLRTNPRVLAASGRRATA